MSKMITTTMTGSKYYSEKVSSPPIDFLSPFYMFLLKICILSPVFKTTNSIKKNCSPLPPPLKGGEIQPSALIYHDNCPSHLGYPRHLDLPSFWWGLRHDGLGGSSTIARRFIQFKFLGEKNK